MKVAIVGGLALVIMAFDASERYDFLPPASLEHNHPPEDIEIHEKFYSKWHAPDGAMCCSGKDCYPTEVRFIGESIYAKRREDGKFIYIPPRTVDRSRESPDGRNHMCAPSPSDEHPWAPNVYCFILGNGT
jgi:hypothetical protein